MIIVGQTASVFIFTLFIYNMTCIGSIPLAVFISLLQGLCGMMFGNHQFKLTANYCRSNSFKNYLWHFRFFFLRFLDIGYLRWREQCGSLDIGKLLSWYVTLWDYMASWRFYFVILLFYVGLLSTIIIGF